MTNHVKTAAGKRVLVVEDEIMIRMLLEGMLADLGHSVAAEAGDISQAMDLARQGDFDLAVLDVNLNGNPVTPVVEILTERGVPFIFASGYGQRGLSDVAETVSGRRARTSDPGSRGVAQLNFGIKSSN